MQLLLKHGARVNVAGGRHGSALRAALDRNRHEVAKVLQGAGAEKLATFQIRLARTALHVQETLGETESPEEGLSGDLGSFDTEGSDCDPDTMRHRWMLPYPLQPKK